MVTTDHNKPVEEPAAGPLPPQEQLRAGQLPPGYSTTRELKHAPAPLPKALPGLHPGHKQKAHGHPTPESRR